MRKTAINIMIVCLAVLLFPALLFAGITGAEYFFDTDPGPGNGVALSVTQSGGNYTITENVSTAGLTDGMHFIYVRYFDDAEGWGPPRGQAFFVSGSTPDAHDIIAAEYFIDTDPGAGSGTNLDITKSNGLAQIAQSVDAGGLANGKHIIYVRYKDAVSGWGPPRGHQFTVSNEQPPDYTIAAAEYFIDTDPGIGNGETIDKPVDGTFDEAVEEFNFDPTLPAIGNHQLFLRLQDNHGHWGPARAIPFKVEQSQETDYHITAAEYFIDEDPGQGNGEPIDAPLDGAFDEPHEDFKVDAAFTNLSYGGHIAYIRTKGSDGKWGPARGSYFVVSENAQPVIAAAEYFFNSDPGQGNGIPLPPQDGTYNNLEEAGEVNVPVSETGLSEGAHTVFVRFKNSQGDWGGLKSANFNIVVKPVIEVSTTALDFEQVVIGDSKTLKFSIRNAGDDTLKVTDISISPSNLGYSVTPTDGILYPNDPDSIVVSVTFNAAEPSGQKNATLTINNNDVTKTVALSAEAIINPTPTIKLSIEELAFDAVPVDKDSVIIFQISNLGSQNLEVTNIQSGNSVFTVTDPTSFPVSVALGTPKNVSVKFTPKQYTQYEGNLTIYSNDPANGTKTVTMSGEGTPGPPTRVIAIGQDTLDFGLVTKDSSTHRNLTINNDGNAYLHISSVSSSSPAIFNVDNPPTTEAPLEIEPAGSANLTVNFMPDAVTSFAGTLTISSDATNSSTERVHLLGKGVAGPTPNIVMGVSTLNFGELKVGKQKQLAFNLSNQGNADLVVNNITVNDNAFSVTSATAFTLVPGDDRDISVLFQPAAAVQYQTTLTIKSNTEDASISLRGTGTQLSIVYDPASVGSSVDAGTAIDISMEVTSPIGSSGFCRLFFRQGGKMNYDSLSMANIGGSYYSATIPANQVTSRGLSYYLKAGDGEDISTAPANNPQTAPYAVVVAVPSGITKTQDQPAGADQTYYRMISVPLAVNGAGTETILSAFGTANIEKWRLFRWQSGKYVEHSESGFQNFAPGRGYWFITTVVGKLQSGNGNSLPVNQGFNIDLQPDWNQIGAPFSFDVAWDEVTKSANVGVIYSYSGSDYTPATNLQPWEGYFVKNSSNNPETITIPPVESSVPGTVPKFDVIAEKQGEWQMRIKARSGKAEDFYNLIGMLQSALPDYDPADLVESPKQPGEYLKLYFPHRDWDSRADNYGFDFRPLSEDGDYWDFELLTNSSADNSELEFTELDNIPERFDILLVDKDTRTAQDLRENNYLSVGNGDGSVIKRHFRIIVGAQSFISENNLGINLTPDDYEISQNYPNPFNPLTTIKYGLPVRSRVTIRIYNVLGQRVKTLVDKELDGGYYNAQWDATNHLNQKVANGVYFYHIVARGLEGKNRLFSKTRKMILLK